MTVMAPSFLEGCNGKLAKASSVLGIPILKANIKFEESYIYKKVRRTLCEHDLSAATSEWPKPIVLAGSTL